MDDHINFSNFLSLQMAGFDLKNIKQILNTNIIISNDETSVRFKGQPLVLSVKAAGEFTALIAKYANSLLQVSSGVTLIRGKSVVGDNEVKTAAELLEVNVGEKLVPEVWM